MKKDCPYCHQVHIVLEEKGVVVDFVDVSDSEHHEELLELNPYGTVPTLVDRDLVLYQTPIVLEYLEERFPHPPLMPVYPVARGRTRLMMARIDSDWYALLHKILSAQSTEKERNSARKDLLDSLLAVLPVFAEAPFFLSEEFSLVDCGLAALLWRLPALGVEIPVQGKAIMKYAKRLFDRESFRATLPGYVRQVKQRQEEE
jgi:RNA polymerase-associated protein